MLLALAITLGYFTIFFIVATIIKNNSIVDIGWGLGFVIVSWCLFLISGNYSITKIMINIMVSLWGIRLFYHILKRNIFEKEDFRYANWRKSWGKWVIPRAFIQVFMLQGLLQFLIGSTSYYINSNDLNFRYFSLIGVIFWGIGYYFQVVSDRQLKLHISDSNNRGKLLTSGLWSKSRHPNYFGESLMWWGIFIFSVISGAPFYLIISPLTISIVLYFISTPLLETRMETYEGWAKYKERTPIFVPNLLSENKGGKI